MPDPGRNPAADWLLAEYDTTGPYDPSDPDTAGDDEAAVEIYVQPMFGLKSVMESGEPMRVTRADYYDYRRWWL